jgi:DNA-binding XRE family transcriptional regulator
MNDDHITNRIRRLRFDHGEMTQQQLADKVGVEEVFQYRDDETSTPAP